MALRISNIVGKSSRIGGHTKIIPYLPASLTNLQLRPIMTSLTRMEKALEHLKTNPYFEKYAKNIARLQETSPEEFLSRIEEREKTTQQQKEKRAMERKFQQQCAAKPSEASATSTRKSLNDIMKLDLVADKVASSGTRDRGASGRRGFLSSGTTWARGRAKRYEGFSRSMLSRSYGQYGQPRSKPFYVTTPIFYVNAGPHIGHLYTAVLADAMTRYHAMLGYDAVLATGTDEHGNKVADAAAAAKLPVQDYCRAVSSEFREMCDRFDVRYSHFIRTTDDKHRKAVQHFWNTLRKGDNIYLGKYSGWYCVPDEAFVPSSELTEKKSPSGETIKVSAESGHPVEWTEEENYKFRLSAYQNDLKHWLKNVETVRPAIYHKILSDWIEDGSCLEDLSVSRPAKRAPWGISVPDDESHTIYVWLDALVNYLTSMGYPSQEFPNKCCWPPSIQVIGKDILKFHGVYWPAFLIAAGLEPPRTLLCHSHWTVDDEKMSKSKGNVVSPFRVADELTDDGLRYFLLREAVPHNDANYSETKIRRILNAELADTFGNLVSRCMGKSLNPTGEIVDPALHLETLNSEESRRLVEQLNAVGDEAWRSYDEANLHHAVDATMATLHAANKVVDRHKPWQLRKESNAGNEESRIQLEAVLSLALETCRISALVLLPIAPKLCTKLLDYFRVPEEERTWENTRITGGFGSRQATQGTSAIVFRRIKI